MDICANGMRLLLEFEGKHKKIADGRYKAYKCPAGVWTLYAGLTKGIKEGMICTESEGERMLRRELVIYEDAIERLVKVPLNQNQFSALTLLVFNIGVGAFQKSTLLKLLNEGKYSAAAGQFERWVNGGGRKLPGLVRRRKAEAALFMTPVANEKPTPTEEPDMPQAVEEAKPSVTEIVGKSWTIRGAVAALLGGVTKVYEWSLSGAAEAGQEAGKMKQSLSGWDALLSFAGANMGLLAAGLVVAGCCVVIARRIHDHREGRA